MGFSAAIVVGAVVAGAQVYSAYEQHQDAKDARKQAEDLAAQQRQSLAALQAEPTPVIPIADEQAKKARRRSITDQLRRRGRSSTILTGQSGPSDSLGA